MNLDKYEDTIFEEVLQRLQEDGFRVDTVTDESAIIHNNGVKSDYVQFTNFIYVICESNNWDYLPPSNKNTLHSMTVLDDNHAEDYDIYVGIYKEDPVGLDRPENLNFENL